MLSSRTTRIYITTGTRTGVTTLPQLRLVSNTLSTGHCDSLHYRVVGHVMFLMTILRGPTVIFTENTCSMVLAKTHMSMTQILPYHCSKASSAYDTLLFGKPHKTTLVHTVRWLGRVIHCKFPLHPLPLPISILHISIAHFHSAYTIATNCACAVRDSDHAD